MFPIRLPPMSGEKSPLGSWASLLIVVIRFGERPPLNSIRFGVAPWRQSLRYGCILAGACGVTAWIVIQFTGYGHRPGSAEFNKIPIWLEMLMVFERGSWRSYFSAVTRLKLEAIGCGRIVSAAIPLAIFAAIHWTGGVPNIIVALVLGTIVTVFYVWRRDLVANMVGHGLSDLLGLVLPRFFLC